MDMFPDPVRVEPLAQPGRGTTVRGKYRVDMGRRGGTHVVYDDRHGVYCEEHGRECAAVGALAEWSRT